MSAAPATAAGPFNPLDAGHAESRWRLTLNSAPQWQPNAAPLIVVGPHPDDEVLGAGGLIREWFSRGHSVTVISVTDGEAAYASPSPLGAVRRLELCSALRRLSEFHVPVVRLGLPDGRVEQCRNRLRTALASLLTADATLVAPYEQDGHPDHDAVGKTCLSLAGEAHIPCVRYPIWRWHHGDTAALHGGRWGRFPLSPETRRAKARAIRCFTSQIAPAARQPILPSHVLQYFARPFEAFLL